MNTYRITVAYDGTAYRGWQRQENTELTVQGILERRISEITGKKTVVSGSGRTDSGVHALGQSAVCIWNKKLIWTVLRSS